LKLFCINKNIWYCSILAGFCVSIIFTSIILTWECLENPSGLFYSQSKIHWGFIYDTGISWFIPTFSYTAIIAAFLQLVYSAIKRSQ